MIIGCMFAGDDNETLKRGQHDAYMELVGHLYQSAANYYLLDARYTWVFPDFVPILRTLKGFDHRVLQHAHDMIAAFYRYSLCPHQNTTTFPEEFDCNVYYLAAWKAFFLQEVRVLGKHEETSKAIVTAVAYQNTDRGYEAEDRLHEILLQRYRAMPLYRNKG